MAGATLVLICPSGACEFLRDHTSEAFCPHAMLQECSELAEEHRVVVFRALQDLAQVQLDLKLKLSARLAKLKLASCKATLNHRVLGHPSCLCRVRFSLVGLNSCLQCTKLAELPQRQTCSRYGMAVSATLSKILSLCRTKLPL